MIDRSETSTGDDEIKSAYCELDELREGTTSFFRKRLILWAIRWTIGFAVIWAVVSYQPDWSWLWWAGGAIALASLVALVFAQKLLQRKLDETKATMDNLDAELARIDRTEN